MKKGKPVEIKQKVETTYLSETYFRPQTRHNLVVINFFLSQGGLGDYINHMPAFFWLAEKNPHVQGRIFVNQPFYDVAKYLMSKYRHWSVYKKTMAPKVMKTGEAIVDPIGYRKYISATGAHLMDLGFMYYCNHDKAHIGYDVLPRIKYSSKGSLAPSDIPFAVFTPGATADARAMPAKHFNNLVSYAISKGVTPVFLGKADFANQGKKQGSENGYYASFNPEYDFSKGIDLREKTTLLEATEIMSKAKFVIGIDNGLLHFAGCTETPIIFGHTVAEVRHRLIRRPKGVTLNIHLDQKSLPCIGCQSNMRYLIGHKFRYCVYGDYKCLDLIFADDASAWKQAIDKVLEG